MKRLIVNADDFGLSEAVTLGILEAMAAGVVKSSTVMLCLSGVEKRLRRLAPKAKGRLGLHLMLTNGQPLLGPRKVPSLVDEQGHFPRSGKDWAGRQPDPKEVMAEWRAQYSLLRRLGLEHTHLDTHHSVHMLPTVFPVYCRLAQETKLPARPSGLDWIPGLLQRNKVRCPDYSEAKWSSGQISKERLLHLIDRAFERLGDKGAVELMSHPGRVDAELKRRSHYLQVREQELAVFTSPGLLEEIEARGIKLISWAELGG
jgi:predicted glycoside hydrolase/deacetylase ChbG (UPF0249 family)